MITSRINLLQAKHPLKTLAAVDVRSALASHVPTPEDAPDIPAVIHARKPRSRDRVDLMHFDEEVELFIGEEPDMVYYMPRCKQHYRVYKTHVALSESTAESVAQVAEAALKQSLAELGEMKNGESRIFWIANEQPINHYPMIHATVVKERHEHRVVAEIGCGESNTYVALLSLGIPTSVV